MSDSATDEHVSDAALGELFSDIDKLRNEVIAVSQNIDTLAPKLVDIDAQWLHSRKNSLNAEFREMVKATLAEESKVSMLDANINLKKASDRLDVVSSQQQRSNLFWSFGVMLIAVIVGISSSIITVYLYSGSS